MNGWRSNTLRSYNSAVRKFLKFAKEKLDRRFELPATHEDIIGFCYWAGRNEDDANPNEVSGATLTKYLHGMKAWHTYHGVQCPYHSDKKVALMIKASLRADALATRQKAKRPVMVELVSMNWISSANQLCQTQPAVHKDFRKFAHRPIDAACTIPTYCMSLPLGSISGGL
ncbi:hypothetical protein PGTUg99_035685 [Puccinia graminis f. sp. tritici]|uniref:Core-binding (CB) domain-containing protein n=1 Tax=Puccinia graminis f. sp. tritici TaxID=56615 RepID=A0A5B0RG05_PUCGR|nr:hypothetical protein PGTUg99_035685 [Puccinia graminis f. sp. tritici]